MHATLFENYSALLDGITVTFKRAIDLMYINVSKFMHFLLAVQYNKIKRPKKDVTYLNIGTAVLLQTINYREISMN